jgi:hypothetical protein
VLFLLQDDNEKILILQEKYLPLQRCLIIRLRHKKKDELDGIDSCRIV